MAAKSPQSSQPHMVPVLLCHSHVASHSHRESVNLCHTVSYMTSHKWVHPVTETHGVIYTVSLNFGAAQVQTSNHVQSHF